MAQVRLRRGRAYVVAAAIFVVLFFFLGTTQDWHYGSDKKLGRLQAYGSTFRHGVGDPSTEDWNPNLRKPHEGESDTLVIRPPMTPRTIKAASWRCTTRT